MSSENPQRRNPFFDQIDEDPEAEASKILEEMKWDSSHLPIDLIEICDRNGFEYEFDSRPAMEKEATTEVYGQGEFKVIINTYGTDNLEGFSANSKYRKRQRFSFAHELGHCVYTSHTDVALQQALQEQSNPDRESCEKKMEAQANQFAAHLLVPRAAFNAHAQKIGWGSIDQLVASTCDVFDVSLKTAILHAAHLADFPCIAILFKPTGGVLKTPHYSPAFQKTGLFYSKTHNVPEGTQAQLLLKEMQSAQYLKNRYPNASTWFPEKSPRITEKYEVVETSISLGTYGVASFLEIIPLGA